MVTFYRAKRTLMMHGQRKVFAVAGDRLQTTYPKAATSTCIFTNSNGSRTWVHMPRVRLETAEEALEALLEGLW